MRNEVWRRRLIIRLVLVVAWIGLGALFFVLNRGHTLLVDNRNVESPGLIAPDMITVSVDNGKATKLFRGDRDLFQVSGIRHRINIEFSDGTPSFEKEFKIPLWPDMFQLSIPKMINGIEPFIEVFHTSPELRNDEFQIRLPDDL